MRGIGLYIKGFVKIISGIMLDIGFRVWYNECNEITRALICSLLPGSGINILHL